MNLFTCRARIVTVPCLFLYKQKSLVQMLICLQNLKKSSSWYCIHARTHGRLARQLIDKYGKSNSFIIHGHIRIRSKKNYTSKKKFMVLNIKKVYPEILNK